MMLIMRFRIFSVIYIYEGNKKNVDRINFVLTMIGIMIIRRIIIIMMCLIIVSV